MHIRLPTLLLLVSLAAPAFAQAGGRNATGAVTRLQTTVQNDTQQVSTAQSKLDDANKALSAGIEKRGRDFEKSPDLKTAQKAITDATAQLDAARDAALKRLKDSPAYTEASAKLTAAKARLAPASLKPNADQAAAQNEVDRLDAIINALEESAVQSDPDILTARQKLAAANTAVKDMKDKFTTDAATDPDLASLHKAADDAKTALAVAVSKLEADKTKLEQAQERAAKAPVIPGG